MTPRFTDVRGGGQSGVVNVDGQVVGGLGEGFRTDYDEVCFVTVEFEKVYLHPGFNITETVGEGGDCSRGDGGSGNVG